MEYMTTVEMSEKWNITSRRIGVLCSEGRIEGVIKKGKTWLIPADAIKPVDQRIKSGKYMDWRNKTNMTSGDFESNLKNLKGTFAVESMTVSDEGIKNLKRIDSGKVSYADVIEELKLKYTQRV